MTIRKRGARYHYDFMIRRKIQRGVTRGAYEGRSTASRGEDQEQDL